MKSLLALISVLGLFLTKASGQAVWTPSPPLISTFANTTSIAISPVNDKLFIGSTDAGILTSDDGRTWQQVLPHAVISIMAKADGTLLAGGKGTVYRSTDHGLNWTSHPIGSTYSIRKIVSDSQGMLYLVTGDMGEDGSNEEYYVGDGVFTSPDNGQTWTKDTQGMAGTLSAWTLVIGKNDQVYVGTHDGNGRQDTRIGLYTRQKEQTTWQPVDIKFREIENFNVAYLHSIAVDENDSLYIGVAGSSSSLAVGGTLKSADGGKTWRPLYLTHNTSWNYWDQPVAHSFYVSKDGTLWTSNWPSRGILVSKDKGTTWTRDMENIGTPPYASSLHHFQFAENKQNRIFALQPFDNVVYSKIYLLGSDKPTDDLTLKLEVFPNPFQSQLNLRFTVPVTSTVQLQVTDAKGATVYKQEHKVPAGINTLYWMSPHSAPGIYYVSLKTDTYQRTRKVVLLP
ncbi:T9SS type A sorting domain-containing protein [Rufibacter latericius]|uniref:T9SS C-terminal target domain-containing protein n=1 Tax=Rufibacter latericius TaxID=2487040 RepID=A0A3M9MLT3_9BACT|nr:T9SS type A sorting domain-containing protein [Rufibacter latericius]RNI26167.1 T9SS C-terminal target domain-containing protein [Rufibacter latericius]